MINEVTITTEFITLGQFLKYENILPSGGIVKYFIEENDIKVNGERELRRGRKIYPNDCIEIKNIGVYKIVK